MHSKKRKLAMLLAILLTVSALYGCSSDDQPASAISDPPPQNESVIPGSAEPSPSDTPDSEASSAAQNTAPALELDRTQLNSINMLNYLAVLTQEIITSKNSRLYLEEVYSSLLNNTSPDAVDSRALVEISHLLDTLESYRMIGTKREQLEYIYELNMARALRDALPQAEGRQSYFQFSSWDKSSSNKTIVSLICTLIDTGIRYYSNSEQANTEYLHDSWALDEAETAALHELRRGTFNYIVETVREYNLPGSLALTEQAVADYVTWKNKTNNLQIIQFFEDNAAVYQGFGPYWLTLAECYYKQGDYAKCLQAIAEYQSMQTGIFRQDYNYARVLPMGIVAAQQVYADDQYIDTAKSYAEEILANTSNNHWALRYFAALTYTELYGMSEDMGYLQNAFSIALSNVNCLVDEQKNLNAAYLAEVELVNTPSGATSAEKKAIKEYNKFLQEERETAPPPVYEPLLLNCELLFSIAEKMDISASEAERINGILHGDGKALFLAESLQNYFHWTDKAEETNYGEAISFNGTKITIPAHLVAEGTGIVLTAVYDGQQTVITDWTVSKVKRDALDQLNDFTVTYSSRSVLNYVFKPGAQVHIEIIPHTGCSAPSFSCEYEVFADKKLYILNGVEYRKVSE